MKIQHTFQIENADISETAAKVLETYTLPKASSLEFNKVSQFFVYLSEPLREAEYRWQKLVRAEETNDIYAELKDIKTERILNEALAFLHCCLGNFEHCIESRDFVVRQGYSHCKVTFPDKIVERVTELYRAVAQYLKDRAKSALALKKGCDGAEESLAFLDLAEHLGRILTFVLDKTQGISGAEYCSTGKLVDLVRRDQAKAKIALAERSEAEINKAANKQKQIRKLQKLALKLVKEPVQNLITNVLCNTDPAYGGIESQKFCEPLASCPDCFTGVNTQENYGLFTTLQVFRAEMNPEAVVDEVGRPRQNNRAKVENELICRAQREMFEMLMQADDSLWKIVVNNQPYKLERKVEIPKLRLCLDNRVFHINSLKIAFEFKKMTSDDDAIILNSTGGSCSR
ncbi:MAG: hypothetical protein K2X81_27665 [Candidatus Obscuribacterales bacterium]|nr:hypothetical protein [Candidatus Obscuribacterales bacterium]